MLQVITPLLAIFALNIIKYECVKTIAFIIVLYEFVDIITYLLGLVFLADIQRPSANVTRSILLMGINYVSCVFCVTFFFYDVYPQFGEWAALDFAFLGQLPNVQEGILRVFLYLQGAK